MTTTAVTHAHWCSGKPDARIEEEVCFKGCPFCTTWNEGKCECAARSYDPEKGCDLKPTDHDMKWTEGGMHLVCRKCGVEGT